MAIQFKRKITPGAPAVGDILQGELAINFADQLLYTKDDTNTIITIGGGGGAVDSVNTFTGVVVLGTDDIDEGSINFYYTSIRFDQSFATKTTSNLIEGTNLYYTEARGIATFDAQLGLASTDDLSEGVTNLYYTDVRADARVQFAIQDTVSSSTTLYSSAKIDSIVSGNLNYKGGWNALTNTPTLVNGIGTNGDFYKVEVEGTQDLGGGSVLYQVGNDVIYNGAVWEYFPTTDAVDSVNGQTGVVVLNTDNIAEGATNLYYTSARTLADVANAGYGIINDVGVSLTETWSSDRLNTLLGQVTEIDDNATTASTTKTWSINKINANYMPINVDYGSYA